MITRKIHIVWGGSACLGAQAVGSASQPLMGRGRRVVGRGSQLLRPHGPKSWPERGFGACSTCPRRDDLAARDKRALRWPAGPDATRRAALAAQLDPSSRRAQLEHPPLVPAAPLGAHRQLHVAACAERPRARGCAARQAAGAQHAAAARVQARVRSRQACELIKRWGSAALKVGAAARGA